MVTFHIFSIDFWSQLFMILTALGAFIFSIKYAYRNKQLRFIPYYVMASILQDSAGFYNEYLNKDAGRTEKIIQNISGNMFLLVEFIVLTNFLLNSTISGSIRRVTRIVSGLFLLCICLYWLGGTASAPNFYNWSPQAFALESLLLIIPCLFYFYELFKLLHPVKLNDHPSFWVVTGILFYNSCSIPLFLLLPFIKNNLPSYYEIFISLNNILYGIFFLLLTRASYLARNYTAAYG